MIDTIITFILGMFTGSTLLAVLACLAAMGDDDETMYD